MTTGSDEQRTAPPSCTHRMGSMTCGHPQSATVHNSRNPMGHRYVGTEPPAPESLPVGTDSARAEAERRWPTMPLRPGGGEYASAAYRREQRDTFIAGAEWARAEERKRVVPFTDKEEDALLAAVVKVTPDMLDLMERVNARNASTRTELAEERAARASLEAAAQRLGRGYHAIWCSNREDYGYTWTTDWRDCESLECAVAARALAGTTTPAAPVPEDGTGGAK